MDRNEEEYSNLVNNNFLGNFNLVKMEIHQKIFVQNTVRNRTFVKVAKNEGIEKLAEYVLKNQANGIMYGWNKDYDNLENEDAVIDLLHNGLNSKFAK